MSPLQWSLICTLFALYLCCGGGVFMYFEQNHEFKQNRELLNLKKDVKDILLQIDKEFYSNTTSEEVLYSLQKTKEDVIHRISDVCGVGDLLQPQSENTDPIKWTYYNSVFFAFTIVTTIGYGALTPATSWSKIFVIIYALIGIPINTILLTNLSKYFARRFVKKRKKFKELNYQQNSYEFFLEILVYLVPGLTVLIFIPSVVFVLLEGWTYLDSVYYSFVTLLTIGFGDYVAAIGQRQTFWMVVYKISLIIWIIFGLGYLLMVLGFIIKGMTSKHVKVVIERRINNLSSRKERLTRDIEYMRRVVNELYLMKVKPSYKDDEEDPEMQFQPRRATRRRSSYPGYPPSSHLNFINVQNTPNLLGGVKRTGKHYSRKSSVAGLKSRRASESYLQAIDKDLTFKRAEHDGVKPDELLTAVIQGLTGRTVMDAAEELRDYDERWRSKLEHVGRNEDKAFFESDDDVGWDDLEEIVVRTDCREFGDLKRTEKGLTWDIASFSDQEIQDDEELDRVVVHTPPTMSRNSSFFDTITGAMRKISSFGRFSSGPPSRKTSRTHENHEDENNRNISSRRNSTFPRNESFDRSVISPSPVKFYVEDYHHPHFHHHMHPMAYYPTNTTRQRKKRNSGESSKVSTSSRVSQASSSRTYPVKDVVEEYLLTNSTRKFSSPSRISLSLQRTSLGNFLTALDKVHARLNSVCQSQEDFIRSTNMTMMSERKDEIPRRRQSLYNLRSGPTKTPRRKYGTAVKPDILTRNIINNMEGDEVNKKGWWWGGGRKVSLLWGGGGGSGRKISKKNDNFHRKQTSKKRSSSIF